MLPGLVGLVILAVAVYFWTRHPQLVKFTFNWPRQGILTWQPWPYWLRFQGRVKIRQIRWAAGNPKFKLDVVGRLQFLRRWQWRMQREVTATLPMGAQSRRQSAQSEPHGPPAEQPKLPWPGLTQTFPAVKIHRLRWHSVIGAGDAFTTAIAVGAAWQIKAAAATLLASGAFSMQQPAHLSIQPRYNSLTFNTTCHCILAVPFRDIIKAARAAAVQPIREQSEGVTSWSTPSKA